jgi:sn-glycerol 3-phosphate transport system permease protein
MRTRVRRSTAVAVHVILGCLVVVMCVPVVFAFLKASQNLTVSNSPSLAPGGELLDNVWTVLSKYNLARLMLNTLVIVCCITVGKTLLSLLAAAAFVYFDFPLRGPLFVLVLFTLMLPTEVLVIALYDLVTDLGIYDTYAALVIPFLASATGTLLFRQHFMKIPRELLDSGKVDGADPMRILVSIVLPLTWNVIAALAVIEFVYVWNAYLWPFLVIQESERQMVQVGLSFLITQQEVSHVGVVMAGVALSMLPPVIVFMILQRRFLQGFALGSDR